MNIKKLPKLLDKTSWKLLLAFLLLFLSLFVFNIPVSHIASANYSKDVQNAKNAYEIERTSLYAESQILYDDITKAFFPLYAQLLQKEKDNESKSMAELLLTDTGYSSDILSVWNGAFRYEENNYRNNYGTTWYYLKNTKTNTVYTNNEELEGYLTETPSMAKDTWYLTFSYNESGNMTRYFASSNDAEKQDFYSKIDYFNSSVNEQISTDFDEYGNRIWGSNHEASPSIRTPRDVEAVFVIKEGQISAPSDAYNVTSNFFYPSYYEEYFDFYYKALIVVLAIGVFIFSSTLKDCTLLRWMRAHISLELHLLGTLFFLFLSWCYRTMPAEISFTFSVYYFTNDMLFGLFAFLLFALAFLFVSSSVCLLKSIFRKEQGGTLRDNLLHYTLLRKWQTYREQITFSSLFRTKTRSVLLFILFVIIAVFLIYVGDALFYSSNFLLLALSIYGFFLYRLFASAYKNEQKQYRQLESFSRMLTNGEYAKLADTELGMYEPIKENLLHVSEHIEEAVQAELQSRNMKNELITNVSHDLKTPLTSIISYIDLLKKKELSEEERAHYLDILSVSSNRLKHLIEDLFEISKANSGAAALQPMKMDIISLIRQVELECSSLLKKRNLVVRNDFSDEKIMLTLDPQKTFRILENLISNAGKYAMPNSRIFLQVSDYDSFVHICIRNVSEKELLHTPEQLLERFVRGDASRNSEGSGLGLAIAKSFTELQGGQMSLQIDADLFKVTLRFPKAEEPSAPAEESTEPKTDALSSTEASGNEENDASIV